MHMCTCTHMQMHICTCKHTHKGTRVCTHMYNGYPLIPLTRFYLTSKSKIMLEDVPRSESCGCKVNFLTIQLVFHHIQTIQHPVFHYHVILFNYYSDNRLDYWEKSSLFPTELKHLLLFSANPFTAWHHLDIDCNILSFSMQKKKINFLIH